MGTTRISWLKKVSDGFMFREDFENRYFVDNDQWQTLQGIPELTDVRSVAGTFALDMGPASNDDNDCPVIIRKPISVSAVLTFDWLVTVWYYDTMDAALEGPFLKVQTADGKYYQVGVRNAISTTHYAVNQDATTTEDNFKASTVARSLGWHKFQAHLDLDNTKVDIIIDGTTVQSITYTSIGALLYVLLQGGVLASVTDSFGYFDELRVQHSASIKFYGLSGRSIAFAGYAAIPVSTEPYVLDATETPTPSLYDFQVSQADDDEALDLYWLSQEFNGGDVFYFNSVDFGRKALPVNYNLTTIGTRNTSPSGKIETTTTGARNKLSFTLSSLQGEQWRQAETLLFDWLRGGNPVSVSIDTDDAAYTKITTTYARAGISSLTVQAALGVSTAGIVPGRYILEATNRIARQVLNVSGNTSGTLAFTPPLNSNFGTGDIIRSLTFFPMMVSDPNISNIIYKSGKTLRYDWSFNMTEFVP